MNKQELIEKIKASHIGDVRKQQILNLLENNDLNQEIKNQVKDLIQADIDSDTSIPFTAEDRVAIDAITAQTNKDLSEVEETLTSDMKFVEKELADLETLVNDMDKVADQAQTESIRATI